MCIGNKFLEPNGKRLAIDLAGIRQALLNGSPTPEKPLRPPLHWLPTGDQVADLLTKRLKAADWWCTVKRGFLESSSKRGRAKGIFRDETVEAV